MKSILIYCWIVTIIAFCLQSCENNTSNKKHFCAISQIDSLKIVSKIIEDLKTKMYVDQSLDIVQDTTNIHRDMGCFEHPSLQISMNGQKRVMINNQLINDLNQISPIVIEFYSYNENKNDLQSPFPLFTRISKSEIKQQIDRIKDEISVLKKDVHGTKRLHNKQKERSFWESNLHTIKTLKVDELLQIEHSNVKIYSQKQTNEHFKKAVIDSVLMGIYRLNERSAQHYFRESYLRIWYRNEHCPTNEDKNKLGAIECIRNVKIIDESREDN